MRRLRIDDEVVVLAGKDRGTNRKRRAICWWRSSGRRKRQHGAQTPEGVPTRREARNFFAGSSVAHIKCGNFQSQHREAR